MKKTYHSRKYRSHHVFIRLNGRNKMISFEGNRKEKGTFSTASLELQQALESDPQFGSGYYLPHNPFIPPVYNGSTVDSCNVEFGYELLSAVPYAYGLHKQGKLRKTISGELSCPLYYFSPDHQINYEQRKFQNVLKARQKGLPWTEIHQSDMINKEFPLYKQVYANDEYRWEKPTLCVCNRANIEWSHSMINYFDKEILDWIFKTLKPYYEIIYFPVSIPKEIQDGVEPIDIGDIVVARKHKVKVFTEMLGDYTWNAALLRVFANCEHYITMNGGYSILASMFSGQNIIYSKPGAIETKEIKNGAFWRWYPNINNVQTLHVPSYDKLKEKINTLYINKLPTANVIIRTSSRPNAFKRCIESVLKQDYQNVNIVVVCDDKDSLSYTNGYPCRVIIPEKIQEQSKPPGENYGVWFPYNDYLKQAQERVDGFIFFLDDDDIFLDNSAITKVINKSKKEHLTLWRVKFPDKIRPSDSWGKKPKLYDISGIGFCYHSDDIDKSDWSPWKRADYRTAAGFTKYVRINQTLTGLQDKLGGGQRRDVKKKSQSY